MTRKLVFWTAFNSYRSERCLRGKPAGAPHPVTTREWTARRAELWRTFTLNSLLFQSHTDWLYVVLLDPELRPLTESILPKHPDRAGNRVIYCYQDEPALRYLREFDEIVFALVDADDMYAREAGRLMMECPAEWMYFKHGYAFNASARRLWAYDTIGSGPFFAHRMDPKALLRFDRVKRHPTHKAVIDLKPQELAAGQFCVVLHDINTSSNPEMRYVLRDKPQPLGILKRDFGR